MKTIFAIYLVLAAATTTAMANHAIDESENPRFLFVMSAESGSYDGETLTLTGVPAVVYFSDRPCRIAGHMSLDEFVEMWEEGVDDFATDPPNAALAISGFEETIIVELIGIAVVGSDSISYQIRILSGSLFQDASNVSLFIDYTHYDRDWLPPYQP